MSPKPHTNACGLKQLPPTLYNNDRTATAGYSKVSRGLRVPLEFPGLCTRKKSSGDTSSGQWRSRYTIHASRHSIGKVLRSIYVTTSFKFLEADKTFLLVSTYRYMVRTVSSKFFRKKIFIKIWSGMQSLRIFLFEKSFLLIISPVSFLDKFPVARKFS